MLWGLDAAQCLAFTKHYGNHLGKCLMPHKIACFLALLSTQLVKNIDTYNKYKFYKTFNDK